MGFFHLNKINVKKIKIKKEFLKAFIILIWKEDILINKNMKWFETIFISWFIAEKIYSKTIFCLKTGFKTQENRKYRNKHFQQIVMTANANIFKNLHVFVNMTNDVFK